MPSDYLGSILDSLSEAVVVLDIYGDLKFVNLKAREIFGLTQDDLNKSNYYDVITGLLKRLEFRSIENKLLSADELPLNKALKNQETTNEFIFGVGAKNKGSKLWLRCSTYIIWDQDDPYLIIGSYSDITQVITSNIALQNHVLELRKKEQFQDVLFDNLEEAIIAVDDEMRFNIFNQKALLFHNIDDPNRILKRRPTGSDLFYPNGTALAFEQNPLVRAFSGEIIKGFHLVIAPSGGKRRDVLVNASPLIDSDGKKMGAVAVMRDITEEKKYELKLIDLALKDPLTALPNRILLLDRLEQALERSLRENVKVGVMVLDIDNFKDVNDTYGHRSGDEVLKVLARRYLSVLRPTDTVARFGGDEYVIVAILDGNQDLDLIKMRIEAVTKLPIRVKETNIVVSVSIGMAISSEELNDEESLLSYADSEMYKQKRLKHPK